METNKVLDGKLLSNLIKEQLKVLLKEMVEDFLEAPCLAIVTVGEDPASKVYVNNKKKACEYIGITCKHITLPSQATQTALIEEVQRLNEAADVHGIIVQLPLPSHILEQEVLQHISPEKDVDGFTAQNLGALLKREEGLKSCTPMGVMDLLRFYDIPIAGKQAVVIGRSVQVGKPMAQLLLDEDATVTICHSRTPESELKRHIQNADIIVSAVGKAHFITDAALFKPSAVIVDIGINRDQDNKLCGDIHPDCYAAVSAYTPVPGGVGPMTVATLMSNLFDAYFELKMKGK